MLNKSLRDGVWNRGTARRLDIPPERGVSGLVESLRELLSTMLPDLPARLTAEASPCLSWVISGLSSPERNVGTWSVKERQNRRHHLLLIYIEHKVARVGNDSQVGVRN